MRVGGLPNPAASSFPLTVSLLLCSGDSVHRWWATQDSQPASLLATPFASGLSYHSEHDATSWCQWLGARKSSSTSTPWGSSLAGIHYSLDALNLCSSGTNSRICIFVCLHSCKNTGSSPGTVHTALGSFAVTVMALQHTQDRLLPTVSMMFTLKT